MHANVIAKWLGEVKEIMDTHHFPPQLIFNMDETMLDSSGHKVAVLVRSSSPQPFTENEAKLEHITLILCISAAGMYIRPCAIFPLQHEPYLFDNVKSFFYISGQKNGFIINDIWHEWVQNAFIPEVENLRKQMNCPNQKALLLVDSHSTRQYKPTIDLFEQHNIFVKILPAHSSTILQPLDLTVNGELKRLLKLRFEPKKGESAPTKRNRLMFTTVECLQGAFLAMHITDGFARAGIYPFNINAPLKSNLVKFTTDTIDFSPPPKRQRGVKIAGKVLTTGTPGGSLFLTIPPPPPPQPKIRALLPPPSKPAPQTTQYCIKYL